jgi:hypothetical protein
MPASNELQVSIAQEANASNSADDETPSGRFHDALDGLLSLRAEDAFVSGSLPSEASLEVFATPGNGHLLDNLLLSSRLSPVNLVPHGMSEERVLVLLKYWRYEVATWVCTLSDRLGTFYYSLLHSLTFVISDTDSVSSSQGLQRIHCLSYKQSWP